ncbi:hypothetical protein [Escherichia coli]|uniref:hypothetical protein n=1 Tax=Escherichia coli TaxID=562 RepID=UPI003B286EC3
MLDIADSSENLYEESLLIIESVRTYDAMYNVIFYQKKQLVKSFMSAPRPAHIKKPQSLSGVSLRDGQCDFLCGLVTPGRRLTH